MRVYCLRCEKKTVIRSSREMSPKMRQLYCSCSDPECGHSLVMDFTFSHTLSPSALDLPENVRQDIRAKSTTEILSLFAELGT